MAKANLLKAKLPTGISSEEANYFAADYMLSLLKGKMDEVSGYLNKNTIYCSDSRDETRAEFALQDDMVKALMDWTERFMQLTGILDKASQAASIDLTKRKGSTTAGAAEVLKQLKNK